MDFPLIIGLYELRCYMPEPGVLDARNSTLMSTGPRALSFSKERGLDAPVRPIDVVVIVLSIRDNDAPGGGALVHYT